MNTISMNSKNSKICDPHRIDEKKEEKINIFFYQILVFTIYRKILKSYIRIISLKYQLQHEIKNLNHLIDHISYQIFTIILNICLKSMGKRQYILQ